MVATPLSCAELRATTVDVRLNNMNTEAATFWTGAFGLIFQVISLFPRNSRERTKDQEEALLALSDAYHITESYYSHLERHGRSNEREWEIADKWFRVGVLLRKYDQNLANRLDLKSRFWRDGGTWSNDAIRDAGIKLEDVWREVNVRITN
jgi:hypothetical protein